MKSRPIHTPLTARRGVTLVELMVVMTAVAVMLGISVVLLGLAMRIETDGRDGFDRAETLVRLSARFRNDVHEARDASVDGRVLRLEPGVERRVEYRVDEHGELTRVVVSEGKDVAREPFRIPGSTGAKLALRELDGRRFAILTIDVQSRQDRIDPIRPVEVEACVGKTAARPEGGKP